MKVFMLEQFWLLLGSCIVLELIFVSIYRSKRDPTWKIILTVVNALMLLMLFLNVAIVTDRESITECVDASLDACQDNDIEALKPLFADTFDSDGVNKEALMISAEQIFKNLEFEMIWKTDLQVSPPSARLAVFTQFRAQTFKSEWDLTFVQTPEGWKYQSAKPTRVNNQPIDQLLKVLEEGMRL